MHSFSEALVSRAPALRGFPAGIRDAHREMFARLRGGQFLHPARGVVKHNLARVGWWGWWCPSKKKPEKSVGKSASHSESAIFNGVMNLAIAFYCP